MVRIQRVDADLLDAPRKRAAEARDLSPAQRERLLQQRQFKALILKLNGASDVFEVRLSKTDKAITVRQRLLRAAAEATKDVAVRKSAAGFLVGLMTTERRSNRGRKKRNAG